MGGINPSYQRQRAPTTWAPSEGPAPPPPCLASLAREKDREDTLARDGIKGIPPGWCSQPWKKNNISFLTTSTEGLSSGGQKKLTPPPTEPLLVHENRWGPEVGKTSALAPQLATGLDPPRWGGQLRPCEDLPTACGSHGLPPPPP